MSISTRTTTAIASILATLVVGCPTRRDGGDPPPAPPATGALGTTKSLAGVSLPPAPSDSITVDVPAIAPLVLGAPLARDTLDPLDRLGLELTLVATPRDAPSPPLPADAAVRDVWTVVLAEGRAALRFGAGSAIAREGTELRFAHDRAGAIHVVAPGHYRIVPAGASRAFLAEGRADVLPLAPSAIVELDPATRFGRPTVHARVRTAYGVVDLEQIVVEARAATLAAPSKGSNVADARVDASSSGSDALDGAGGALCRFLLDLVASDRVLGGEPCAADRVPVRAEVEYVAGGGLVLDASAVRDATIARDDVAFHPFGATLALPADDGEPRTLVPAATLLALRAKGDAVTLDVSNDADRPRIALLDGLPVLALPARTAASISVRAATYRFEWRTPIGEIIESAFDLQAPASVHATTPSAPLGVAGQLSPTLPSSPSAMASALKGP